MNCTNCGASLDQTATFCGYCGTAVGKAAQPAAATAVASGFSPAALALGAATVSGPATASAPNVNIGNLPEYYRNAFTRIEAGGAGASPWNWAAFLFTPFWYFYRGLWAKGLLMMLVNIMTGGAAWPVFWIYAGKFGNYDLWLARTKGKQLW